LFSTLNLNLIAGACTITPFIQAVNPFI